MTPALTVAISFFNEAGRLGDAIRSVLNQSHRDFELLLIDDGSTDDSVEVARSFDDARVSVIADGRRKNLAARLNEVAARAHAPIVARMDADDVIHPTRFERQLAVLANGDVDIVGSWVGLMSTEGRPFAVVEASAENPSPRRLLESGLLPHPTMMVSREWLRAHPYDERLSRTEDRDLWCRVAFSTRVAVIPEPLYVLRVESNEKGFVPTYLETQRQNRSLFWRHGPALVGWSGVARAILTSHAKSVTMRTAARIGLVDALVRRRGRTPSAAELALIHEAIDTARA